VLFEGSLDVMEDIKDMVLPGAPRAKARREVENPILADQGMEYVRHKLDNRLVLRIVCRKGETKIQDRIGIVALMDEEDRIPDKEGFRRWNNVDPERTMLDVS